MVKPDQEHQRQSKGPDVTGVYTEGYPGWAFPDRVRGEDAGGGRHERRQGLSDLTPPVSSQKLTEEDSLREQKSRQN